MLNSVCLELSGHLCFDRSEGVEAIGVCEMAALLALL